jgi:hypothetical protein
LIARKLSSYPIITAAIEPGSPQDAEGGGLALPKEKDQERTPAVRQQGEPEAVSAASVMRRMVRAQRPHCALQPKQW